MAQEQMPHQPEGEEEGGHIGPPPLCGRPQARVQPLTQWTPPSCVWPPQQGGRRHCQRRIRSPRAQLPRGVKQQMQRQLRRRAQAYGERPVAVEKRCWLQMADLNEAEKEVAE